MTQRREWTPYELMRAKRMRSSGHSYANIDHALGRRVGSTQGKLTYLASEKPDQTGDQLPGLHLASADVLAERDARKEAAGRRDLTSVLCGDPPVGFSMRDRRS